LLAFIYDDYVGVGACGVFPPLHLLNQFLLRGGGGGGMSPGARWDPFTLTGEEYGLLVDVIRTVSPDCIKGLSGSAPVPFTFDPEIDGPPETYPVAVEPKRWDRHIAIDCKPCWMWVRAVYARHRDRWREAVRRAGKTR
jgi:hypothetical protein